MAVESWQDKRLFLGLGNPGHKYRGTRHNRGREVVQELAQRRASTLTHEECRARLAVLDDVVLAIPETFMNRSGFAARCLVERRSLDRRRMLVVFDDVALPLGTLRLRPRGGPGGQRGMASVLEGLRSEEIPRLRLGIAPPGGWPPNSDLVEFVLSPFAPEEERAAREQIVRAADACELWLAEGMEAAMNRFNGPAPDLGGAAG